MPENPRDESTNRMKRSTRPKGQNPARTQILLGRYKCAMGEGQQMTHRMLPMARWRTQMQGKIYTTEGKTIFRGKLESMRHPATCPPTHLDSRFISLYRLTRGSMVTSTIAYLLYSGFYYSQMCFSNWLVQTIKEPSTVHSSLSGDSPLSHTTTDATESYFICTSIHAILTCWN